MKNKETGEFELVVGNGQIISGFFILALLLAVFFAMGFIVARAKYQQEPATTTASNTQPELRKQPAPATSAPPAEQPKAENPPQTQDAAKPSETTPPTQPPDTATAAPPAAAVDEAAPGTYWQVTSTSDINAARAMMQSIKDMGLPASLSPGPKNLTRVLVGPYTDTATLAKVKTQLENAGLQPQKHSQ